ncbi:probable inorganic phosphate transporter 1-3 [Amaranthus tricolor]|uniref:probable inorganic phosphate transporter 1-3 n=1 Tax=Amaranthus tricolor TaxID=29722 RepID=UPI00258BFFF3|nr:probable inorganic phosphate transporter 1-3 [Amaranthus tricolor]
MAKGQVKVLNALDVAKIQWYHFKAILISGMGFFTDAYNLFCISTVARLLGRLYFTRPGSNNPGILPIHISAAVNGIALSGSLFGQLFFGWLGDKIGRKKVYGITLIIMIISTIGSGMSFSKTPKGVITTLCFFRFWVGFGIGGEYPLSATIMAEYANKNTRGTFIAAVFAMQGMGILASALVAMFIAAIFDNKYKPPPYNVDPLGSVPPESDYIWRSVLIFGAVPAVFTLYWRMQMPETARYTTLVAQNPKQAVKDMSNVLDVHLDPEIEKVEELVHSEKHKFKLFSAEFARIYGIRLLGTTTTWFLIDIAFYSLNLFQKDVFYSVGWIPLPEEMSGMREVYNIAKFQALISLCGTIPGYWFTVGFIDIIGRWWIQMMGFFCMTIFMVAIAIPYQHWRTKEHRVGFLILYGLIFFFANFGPNATTFVIPAEIFPARFRSTCHGISAAAGKAGSIIGAVVFLYASQEEDPAKRNPGYPGGIGKKKSIFILCVTNIIGMMCTFLVPETKGKSLEELSGEVDVEDDAPYERIAVPQ